MISSRIPTFLALLFLITSNVTIAQQIGINVDLFGYADNREFKSTYSEDKTYLGTILSPKLYLAVDSNHRIIGGIQYRQDFGKHDQNGARLNPIVYYNYKNKNFDFALGHMPRHERIKDVPLLVLSDTLLYDRPNIEGLYFSYRNKKLQQSIFIDWLSKQSHNFRERFVVGLSGKYSFGKFYLADDLLLYHNALTNNDNIEEHIQDNGVAILRAGINLSKTTILDSLTIDAGYTIGFDRVRNEYELRTAQGFISNMYMGYKRFFLCNTLYKGQGQNLPMGDPFYHHEHYDRIDIGWMPFRKGSLEGKFTASFHFTPGQISNQQAFTLRYYFDSSLWRTEKSH